MQRAVAPFKQRFAVYDITYEKMIDSLIWKTVGLLSDGALSRGQIVYR
jgi:hypothetical protein